ncbi:MAG: YceI family protein [Lewinellaceae bacterium]|nr:YceI family protein [Lewinellaceae bacterium]
MKNFWFCFLLIAVGIVGQGAVLVTNFRPPEKKRYSIVKPSRLYLQGTTNVNTFACDCEDQFISQELQVESGGAVSKFRNARLSMTTRKFNCKNAKMDRDMHKALQADTYPKIRIDLQEARYNPEHLKGAGTAWFDVDAKVQITITGVTKERHIKAQARKIIQNQFALKGSESLQMSEFGIDPPEALFGMIKVNDLIAFHFDLVIQIEDVVN